jgi:hypothetical protein
VNHEWRSSEITVALACGLGAGLMTLARRGAMPSKKVSRLAGWSRWRHSVSGCCLAAGVAIGASLLASDHVGPMMRIGFTLILSGCYDLASSEGLAWIAKQYLSSRQKDEDDLPEKWRGDR